MRTFPTLTIAFSAFIMGCEGEGRAPVAGAICAMPKSQVTTSELGQGGTSGAGQTKAQYSTSEVSRAGKDYIFISNGWGPGFISHDISWNGTSFTVNSMEGNQGPNSEPASYPTTFCGKYSVGEVGNCGLPAAIDSVASLQTGWSWSCEAENLGKYNAAWDIWLGDGTALQGYLMVWLRDPPGASPAGRPTITGVLVPGLPGIWDIWTGSVNGRPIVNYVHREGGNIAALEFDVMDLFADMDSRGVPYPGTHINSVAVGFEIWQGPVTNLTSDDFYVNVQPK
jgi:Glycosyl hydrolase family 12